MTTNTGDADRKAPGMGAWAMLFATRGGKWRVDGGCVSGTDFFFVGATRVQRQRMTDSARCRFVWCPEGVRIGAVVTLSDDGKRVIWPEVTR